MKQNTASRTAIASARPSVRMGGLPTLAKSSRDRTALRVFRALAILVLVAAAGSHFDAAQAASVTWGAAITDSTNTDVFNVGASAYAYDWSSNQTVNGVSFLYEGTNLTGSGSITIGNTTNVNTSAFAPSTLGAAYDGILAGADYNGNNASSMTVTLGNLTGGHVYATQLWVDDSRSGIATRTDTLSSSGGNTVSLKFDTNAPSAGVGQFAIGGFTETSGSTTEVLTITGGASNPAQLNAIQVRDVTGVWSGAVNGNWDGSTANFTGGNSFSTVSGLVNTIYFADTDGFGNAVTNSNITIQSGGVSTGTVVFQNNAVNYTVNSSDANGIGGSTAVALSGTGTVTLNGTNSYSGGTTIFGGNLLLGNASALGATSGSLAVNGGTLDLAGNNETVGALSGSSGGVITSSSNASITFTTGGSGSTTYGGIIQNGSGTVGLTVAGAGSLTLTGSNTYTGPTTVSSGTLQIGAGGATGSLASTLITDNGSMVYSRSDSINLTGTYTGAGSLTLNGGAGTIAIRAPVSLASVTATSSFASAVQSLYGTSYASAINLFANVTTTGNQAYNGIVSIGSSLSSTGATVLTTTGGGSVSLPNGVLGGYAGYFSANQLWINTSAGNGNVTLGGESALDYGIANLSISSGTGTITLTGGSYYYDYSVFNGNVTLSGNTTFQNDGQRYVRGVTFNGNLSGTGTLTATLNGNGAAGSSGTGAQGLIFNTATTQSVSANIAGNSTGSFVLTKTGVGITTFSGSNSYTGGTTISAGALEFSATNAMPSSGTVAVSNGGTLAVPIGTGQFTTAISGAGSIGGLVSGTGGQGAPVTWASGAALGIDTTAASGTYAGVISNPGGNTLGLTEIGSNTLTLTGSNTYSGPTTIGSGGTLQIGGAGVLGSSGTYAGAITNGGALIVTSSANQTWGGAISGTGSFTQAGTGVTILTGANTYTGPTTISSGTLQIGAGGTTGSLASTLITDNGSMVYSRSDRIDLTGTYNGTGSLILNAGAGTIGIRGPVNLASVTATSSFGSTGQSLYGSAYASAINLFANVTTSGNQAYNGIVSIGRGSNPVTVLTSTGGGSISLPGGVVSGVSGYWNAGSLTVDTSAGNGNVTLGGQALAYGVGNLSVNSGAGAITLTGGYYMYDYSVFNSNVALTGSTAFVSAANANLPTAQWVDGVTFNGNVTGPGVTLNVAFGAGSAASSGTGTAGLFFNTATTQLVSANIIGTAAPTKTGLGVATFSGTDTYTGATKVNGGTLIVSGSLTGTVSVAVASNATLEVDGVVNSSATVSATNGTLQGTGSIGTVNLKSGATLAPGLTASGLVGGSSLSAGNVTFSDTASALSIGLGITTGSDSTALASSGTVTLDKTPLQLTLGNAINNPALVNTAVYVILNGGAGATGSGTDLFTYNGTTLANGQSFTASGGFTFEILYDKNAAGTSSGNDVDLELTAIPELGTWATVLAGFAMLVGLQRRRRWRREI